MVNKRNAGRKRTTSTDDKIRSDQRERNKEFKEKQNALFELQDTAPGHLNDIGRALWRKIVPELKKLGTIKQIDTVNLEAFCSLYGTYRLAESEVSTNGIFAYTIDEDGDRIFDYSKKNPAYSIMNDSIKTLKSLAVDLGLSFDSRSGQLVPSDISTGDGSKEDKLRLVKFGADI
ncbi:phage terminase small subunit P27 family [Leuconostoc carnosum]|uniref:phage terminase small subunit P27 family n=1 Tax=Leuconostoc carnosum TaxID=1252 RepID=UPI00123BAE4E|nr:phage terminase small subunit P27 family [Leuconostoc carnosum]KAA8327794.1 phage terminase small subunit P27 family [Leuconostoc carnosum]KAA8365009.1 phage terminase small subunit P27 family [Leuconostoc carnosum]KAA8369808.1 phage terminase small subunit P27 family [Leuconostoc carnosum]KAA8372373.1 phage terminase small subunit P27 family [Leuconostoc carnosum]KAA8375259.1 phage terminase small subunit P27 family [Leuconostoc carnosum]